MNYLLIQVIINSQGMKVKVKKIGIIGTGPAGLMAADIISSAGHKVVCFEKRKSVGRKLLIAGSSGLNIASSLELSSVISKYTGSREMWINTFDQFSPKDWVHYVEKIGIQTYCGTSPRYFIKDKKAANFLNCWVEKLKSQDVEFRFNSNCIGFTNSNLIDLHFENYDEVDFDYTVFAIGGGSWEDEDPAKLWSKIFHDKNVKVEPFTASNVGFEVDWPEKFIQEIKRKPLKNIKITTAKGTSSGDILITEYGVEGTPIYEVGCSGVAEIDLFPGIPSEKILQKLSQDNENRSLTRKVKKFLKSDSVRDALFFHCLPKDTSNLNSLSDINQYLKKFKIYLKNPRPLSEAISSAGGISLDEVDNEYQLKKYSRVYAVGEMLNWDAPTGGFLIQACVAQAYVAAQSIIKSKPY